jgi:phosphate acetyltransferase
MPPAQYFVKYFGWRFDAPQLEYLAKAEVSGIVLGARVPIILTSRADKTLARLSSCAIALLMARYTKEILP